MGGSQAATIDLCPQGYLRYSDSNEMAVDGCGSAGCGASGYGYGNDRGNGTWKVVGGGQKAVLVLAFHDGRIQADIPEALPLLMASALASEARPWQGDALPTWVRVERMQSGGYQVVFHFFSPSATQEMRITVTEHGIRSSVHDGSRTVSAPLPLIFMDLPRIVSEAQVERFHGALGKADLRVYKGHGAAWMATFDGARTGAAFSGETGERIHGDVTGSIAQYEADWQKTAEIWQRVWAVLKNILNVFDELNNNLLKSYFLPTMPLNC